MTAPVVLLHSGGMSARQWSRLRATLEADGYEALAPDLAGHGDAPPPPDGRPVELSLDVERTAALLDGLGGPVHLVGHSYGGMVALLVARRCPGKVLTLTVFEPVALGVLHTTPDPEGLADLDRLAIDPVFSDPAQAGTDPWLQRFVEYWSGPGAWDAMGERGRASFRAAGAAMAQGVQALMGDRTTVREHAQVTVPTLVISGERSPVAARRVAALLAQGMPDARLVTVEGAGHMAPLTHADAVNGLILEQLRRTPADG